MDKNQPLLFQNYNSKIGLAIYDDEYSTVYEDLNEATSTMELKKPAVRAKPVVESTYKDLEIGEQKVKTQQKVADPSDVTALGVSGTVNHDIDIDYKPVKNQDVNDMLVVNFKVDGPAGVVKTGDVLFQYLSFREKSTSGDWTTVGCVTTIGSPEASEIISWESATKFDSTTQAGKDVATMKSEVIPKLKTDVGAKVFRKTFSNTDYDKVTANSREALSCVAVWDNSAKYGVDADALFDKTYDVETGVRLFDDANNAAQSKKIAEDIFEFTLAKPNYKFGDAYDFSDKPTKLDSFSKSTKFDVSELISGGTGTGFVKVNGGFRVVPNFELMMFQFVFEVDMAEAYLPSGRTAFFYITRNEKDAPDTKETISCSVEIGNMDNVEVKEFNGDFDKAGSGNLTQFNEANLVQRNSWGRNYEEDNYGKVDSINSKKRQRCTAMVELDLEDV